MGLQTKYQSWAKNQKGNTNYLIAAGILGCTGLYIFYKQIYKPWSRRKTVEEAEKYASYIYGKEANRVE